MRSSPPPWDKGHAARLLNASRHACSHRRHDSAHIRQCSMPISAWRSHSSAQTRQASAHASSMRRATPGSNAVWRVITRAVASHTSAQSRLRRIHRTRSLKCSCSPRQASAQLVHVCAQAVSASITWARSVFAACGWVRSMSAVCMWPMCLHLSSYRPDSGKMTATVETTGPPPNRHYSRHYEAPDDRSQPAIRGSFPAQKCGGDDGNRTRVRGFADRSLNHSGTSPPICTAGCPARIRTSVNGSKVRCPTTRRRGIGRVSR